MSLNLGDAFLTFRGDLTQLNLAFDQAAQNAQEKLGPARAEVDGLGKAADAAGAQITAAWQRVAKATVENYQAQKELSAALFAVKSTGGESVETMDRLATAQARAAAASTELAQAREATIVKDKELVLAEKELTEATNESTFSMHEAKASMALVGEEIGVKIPRHLRGFVAEIPGVGKALEVAFSGVAIFILVQLLVEATQKLSEFVSETFIYTEADKEAYKAQVELNNAIAEQAKKIKELKEAYDMLGLSGSQKTAAEFMKLTEEVRKQEKALRDAQDVVYLYKNGLNDITKEEADAAELVIGKMTGQSGLLAQLYQQQANLSKQYDQELLSEETAHGEAVISHDKTVGEARIALLQAQSRLKLALQQNSYFEQGRAQADFDEQRYQLDLHSLERQRALIEEDMAKRKKLGESDPNNPNKLLAVNAQIEALQAQHKAKLLNDEVDFYNKIQALQKKAPEGILDAGNQIELSPEGKALEQLEAGLRALGIQGSTTWTQMAIDAETAFNKIKENGGTTTDILQAQLRMLTAKMNQALSFGDRSAADKYRGDIQQITAQLEKLGITLDKTGDKSLKFGRGFNSVSHSLDQVAHSLQQDQSALTKTQATFDSVLMSSTEALGGAVTQWVSGQESLGQALKQGLAQEAATIAGKAAMWGAYFTAWGIADLFWNPARASADFAAAAEFFAVAGVAGAFAYGMRGSGSHGGGGNDFNDGTGSPVETTAVSSGNVTPVQNVQHFATGGLVSGPTLAVLGDSVRSANRSQTEAAIPLEDPRALRAIGAAIGQYVPGGSGGPTHVHVTLETDIVQTVRRIDHAVKNNGVKLTASNALRVTKKA